MNAPLPTAGDGWIEWAGGECPVADDAEVQVLWRDNSCSVEQVGATAGYFGGKGHQPRNHWRHDGSANDIIAYRLVKP